MIPADVFTIILIVFSAVGLGTFVLLFFVPAPYGRHARKGWGPGIHPTLAWILMESPAPLLFLWFFLSTDRSLTTPLIAFLVIWELHYVHRTFIYPFMIKNGRAVPLSIFVMSLAFNGINAFLQGTWLYRLAPESIYTAAWLTDPRFIIGIIIFIAGYVINKHSDIILRNLRKDGNGYRIPHGGMYRFVSTPNYMGEIMEWIGFAVATWSPAAAVFAFWTIANLAPRAWSHHKWYRNYFDNYPEERKALVPFIW